jgi:biopolymer transport protein TolR
MAMGTSSSNSRRTRGRGRARPPMAEINVTPFVDVMLVLLIIFMVTAPLLVSGVPVELPESRANALDQKKEPLEISIDKKGAIFVDGQETRFDDLAAKLAPIAASQKPDDPRQIMLRGDRDIDYGNMMRVMGELNRAGLNSVSLVTTGSSGSQ